MSSKPSDNADAPGGDPPSFEVGEIVVDGDEDEDLRAPAVVINLPPVEADEWVAYHSDGEEVTVADDNPDYPSDAEVVVVSFEKTLDDWDGVWNGSDPLPLAEAPRFYSFPPHRLEATGDVYSPPEPDPEHLADEHPGLNALRQRLAESGDVEVVYEGGEPELLVEKLGSTHRVSVDGSVTGGPLSDRIEDVAAEYLGGEA